MLKKKILTKQEIQSEEIIKKLDIKSLKENNYKNKLTIKKFKMIKMNLKN